MMAKRGENVIANAIVLWEWNRDSAIIVAYNETWEKKLEQRR